MVMADAQRCVTFQALRILKRLAEHLHSTADAEHVASPCAVSLQGCRESAAFQGLQVAQSLFAAGNDNGIGYAQSLPWGNPTQLQRGFCFKRVKI